MIKIDICGKNYVQINKNLNLYCRGIQYYKSFIKGQFLIMNTENLYNGSNELYISSLHKDSIDFKLALKMNKNRAFAFMKEIDTINNIDKLIYLTALTPETYMNIQSIPVERTIGIDKLPQALEVFRGRVFDNLSNALTELQKYESKNV